VQHSGRAAVMVHPVHQPADFLEYLRSFRQQTHRLLDVQRSQRPKFPPHLDPQRRGRYTRNIQAERLYMPAQSGRSTPPANTAARYLATCTMRSVRQAAADGGSLLR